MYSVVQHVSEQRKKRIKAWEKRNVFSLDFKTAKETLLLRTVFGSEFQTAGAEH